MCLFRFRESQFGQDNISQWDFRLTVKESKPDTGKRGTVINAINSDEGMQTGDVKLNHVDNTTAMKQQTTANEVTHMDTEEAESEKRIVDRTYESSGTRLSNGIHESDPNSITESTLSQEERLKTTSLNLSQKPNGVIVPNSEDLKATEACREAAEVVERRERHTSARSVSEETSILDEALNRSSVASVEGAPLSSGIDNYERVGGSSSEEDMEIGGREDVVSVCLFVCLFVCFSMLNVTIFFRQEDLNQQACILLFILYLNE